MSSDIPGTDVLQTLQNIAKLANDVKCGNLTDENKQSLLTALKFLTKIFNCEPRSRSVISESARYFYENIKVVSTNINNKDSVFEALRVIRNSLANCPENQTLIRTNSDLLHLIRQSLGAFAREEWRELPWTTVSGLDLEEKRLFQKLLLQVLINSAVGSEENCRVVLFDMNLWLSFLENGYSEGGFLLNTIINTVPNDSAELITPEVVCKLMKLSEVEAAIICLETLGSNQTFMANVFDNLESDLKLSFLQLLSSSTCSKAIDFFVDRFKSGADFVLKAQTQLIESNFEEFLILTSIVSGISSSSDLHKLQSDAALVTTVTNLFRMTKHHQDFQPIEKLALATKVEQNHPAFLFKAYLMRTMGNLAYRHPENQTQIGTDCLELIMNATKIDALNPFITQWSILAIRNLLENHQENQAYVRNMTVRNTAYSSVLEEFGIRLTLDDSGNPVPGSTRSR